MTNNIKNESEKIGILLFSNRKYMFALGTFLLNLREYVSFDEVIVYQDGFTEEDKQTIRNIESRVRLIDYDLYEFAKEFDFEIEKLKNIHFIQRYTVLPIIKFKLFQYLNEFSVMMFFDLDMLLLDNLNDLLVKEFSIAWKDDANSISDKIKRRGVKDEFIKELGMYEIYRNAMTPNGGFVVVKRNFDYQLAYKESVKYLKKYSFLHPWLIDEILLGYVKEKLQLKALYVDDRVYNVWPSHVNTKSKLIHFVTNYKPWKRRLVQIIFNDWKKNYEKYVTLTGMPSKEVKEYNDISKCMLQEDYQIKWNDILNKYGLVCPSDLQLASDLSGSSIEFYYNRILSYKIETEWMKQIYRCVLWFDKRNHILMEDVKEKLRKFAMTQNKFLSYHENKEGFGLKSVKLNPNDVPENFYRLYSITETFKKCSNINYGKIISFHGTKLQLNEENSMLIHSNENRGIEVYANIEGKRTSLFIIKNSMPYYLKDINEDGTVVLTNIQVYIPYINNSDHSISIQIKNGVVLSAGKDGDIVLRHWNRDWEHFFMEEP